MAISQKDRIPQTTRPFINSNRNDMKKCTLFICSRLKGFLLLATTIFSSLLYAQQVNTTVKGRVSGKDGPLAGVTVRSDGTSAITTTDADGMYNIAAPANGTIIFSYSGYSEQRIPIKGQTLINVRMSPVPIRWMKWWWLAIVRKKEERLQALFPP